MSLILARVSPVPLVNHPDGPDTERLIALDVHRQPQSGDIMKMIVALAAGLLLAGSAQASDANASSKAIEHGKFLIGYGGCNDCHTPGWGEQGGQAANDVLLTGSGLNFQGPWGTTYPVNLRLYMQGLSLQAWIHTARTMKSRPAMPWWIFRYLSDQDLGDIYDYIRSLGPAGQPAHAYVPPGQEAALPYLKLVTPPQPAANAARR